MFCEIWMFNVTASMGAQMDELKLKNPGWKNNMITNFALLCKTNKVNIPCATTHMQYKKHTHKPENKKKHNICSNHNVQMHRKQTQNNDCPV